MSLTATDTLPDVDDTTEDDATSTTVAAPAPVPVDDTPKPVKHVILNNETLDSIAELYDMDPAQLWQYNSVHLEGNAQARGHGNSEGGRLLFPGTEIDLTPQGKVIAAPFASSNAQELKRYADLHTAGVLTDAEFTAVKAKLLGI